MRVLALVGVYTAPLVIALKRIRFFLSSNNPLLEAWGWEGKDYLKWVAVEGLLSSRR